jgi:endonuclease/exonuclease/phosphatase family metal-dependent hydrolase
MIAGEIAEHEPDLVGLQEVALWRSGALEPRAIGVRNAEQVDYDFEEMLLEALAERGLDYEPVVESVGADLESPSRGPVGESPRDVRVTLRDVILVRAGHDLHVLRRGSGHFRAQRHLAIGGAGLDFTRGFGWVDVRRGVQDVRFINTHLEVGDSRIGHAQALELVAGPGSASVPVVIVCDCNSDPRRPLRSLPYRALTGAGFVDQWLTLRHGGPGHTCCVPDTLRGSDPPGLDHRVDFVFARATRLVRSQHGSILGRPFGHDPNRGESLRPSDHAGVVMRLRSVRW